MKSTTSPQEWAIARFLHQALGATGITWNGQVDTEITEEAGTRHDVKVSLGDKFSLEFAFHDQPDGGYAVLGDIDVHGNIDVDPGITTRKLQVVEYRPKTSSYIFRW